MHGTSNQIQPHHEAPARMWGLGGHHYDDVSFAISDALAHAAKRLAAQAGETVLDVATGTGWSARNAARSGANVTGIDISDELLAAARDLAPSALSLGFRCADAERLPFDDGAFDRVISTFGVMFAANQQRAADELARVCKPGGRLVLATWVPGGSVAQFFGIVGKHAGDPPPEQSPLAWGDPEHVRSLLGEAFELTFESGTSHDYYDGVQEIWDWYVRGFGPVRQLANTLDAKALAAFRADVGDYHRHYLTSAGLLHVKRDYLLVTGTRR
ncbi:MAG: class I SAM-dependent methyltransferase [Rhizobiaceae bacterium]|nr:class I SAM-dependent methyltransferase [Rhizobiaceae bacterium]